MDGLTNARERLADFDREYGHEIDQDAVAGLTDDEKRFAALFTAKLAEEQEAASKPRVLTSWTGDPTVPLYMRPPFNN